jgi:hypothetical protein
MSRLPSLCALALLLGAGPARSAPATKLAAPAAAEPVEEAPVEVVKRGAESWWGDAHPRIDRVVNLYLARTTRKRTLQLTVDHRTNQPFTENTWHDYFGFDAGSLKIGLGLRYGILENLDAGFYRLNSATERFDVYQFDARYRLLRQERHHLDLGLRAGVTWFSQEDAEDAVGWLGQLLVDRRFFSRLTFGSGLLFHSDSTNGVKSSADRNWSLAVPVLLDVRILGWLSWNLEVAFNVAGYGTRGKRDAAGKELSSWPAFSSAVRFITSRHTFELVLTNNQYTSADGVVANTPRGFDKLIVGFTITRELNF